MIAVRPLEVVECRPVGIAAHVDTVTHTSGDSTECALDIDDSSCIVSRREAILGYDDGETRCSMGIADGRRVDFVDEQLLNSCPIDKAVFLRYSR